MRQNRAFPVRRPLPKSEPPPRPPSRTEVTRRRVRGFYLRFHSAFLLVTGMLIALVAMVLYDSTKPPPQRLTQRDINAAVARAMASATPKPSFASQAYEMIRPSLVQVRGTSGNTGATAEYSLGSGVVIDESGIILSSLHIVKEAAEVQVVFADGTESEANIVAKEPETDLVALRARVLPDDLVPATLVGSGALRVGDEVFAAGSPFGLAESLSAGVVSGLGRDYKLPKTGETFTNLIQFDAAVNSGSSGGPLLDRDGEVVGVVMGLMNPTEQGVFIGIGFAVPLESAGGIMGSPPY